MYDETKDVGYQENSTAATTPRESELNRETAKLHKLTEILLKQVSGLESQLGPVLRPIPPEKETSNPEELVSTQVGGNIREAANRVERALRTISSVSIRLEV